MPEHLIRLLAETSVLPALNQIEVHPHFQQTVLQRLHAQHGILTQARSPIGDITSNRGGEKRTFDGPTITEIGRRHGKSAAQVMLRWHLQEGRSAIPKSMKPARIAENFDIFDFELSSEELAALNALDTGMRGGPEPDSITREGFGREFPRRKEHREIKHASWWAGSTVTFRGTDPNASREVRLHGGRIAAPLVPAKRRCRSCQPGERYAVQ